HMAIGPRGVFPGGRASVVEERRLREEYERTLGAGRPLGLRDLLEGAADVNGRGAAAVVGLPRDQAVECPVDLEDPGTVPVAAKRVRVMGWQLVAGDAEKLPRHDVREDGVGPGQLVDQALG